MIDQQTYEMYNNISYFLTTRTYAPQEIPAFGQIAEFLGPKIKEYEAANKPAEEKKED